MTTRACINVAIVDMVNSTATSSENETSEECPRQDSQSNTTSYELGEFGWSADTQSQVLAVFYYGYIITQLPGGYLAERFGSKLILGWILLSSSILCAVSPLLARFDVRALIACRFLMGLCQGPLYPSMQALWGLWAPPLERTRLMTLAWAGSTIGDLVGLALTGILCSSHILGGWPLPFYVFGGCSFVCFVLWMLFYNDPLHHRCLSEAERTYISTQIYGSRGQPTYSSPPWKSILTSRPFYGVLLYTTLDGMAYYIIFICGPTYMKQVLNFDISEDGLLNAAPYLSNLFSSIAAGPAADFIMTRRWMSVTATRKAFTLAGGLLSAGFTVAMGYVDCDRTLAIVFLVASWGVGGLVSAGPGVSSLDISPQHAGSVMGLLNTFNNVGGFLSPILVLQFTKGKASRFQWQKVFFLMAGLGSGSVISYAILGSSTEQKWSEAGKDVVIQSPDDEERQPLLSATYQQS